MKENSDISFSLAKYHSKFKDSMDWKEKVQVSCKDAAHKISEHTSLHYNFLIVLGLMCLMDLEIVKLVLRKHSCHTQ